MIKVTLLALLSVSTIASATLTFNSTLTDPGEKEPWFDGTITSSSNVTAACASAYAQPIPCDQWLIKSQNEEMAVDSALNGVCTDACLAGLKKWRDDVRKECTSSDVIGVDDGDAAMYIAKLLDTSKKFIEYIYWMDCIRDLYLSPFLPLLPPPFRESLSDEERRAVTRGHTVSTSSIQPISRKSRKMRPKTPPT